MNDAPDIEVPLDPPGGTLESVGQHCDTRSLSIFNLVTSYDQEHIDLSPPPPPPPPFSSSVLPYGSSYDEKCFEVLDNHERDIQSSVAVYKALVRPEAGRITLFRTQIPDDPLKSLQLDQHEDRYVRPREAPRSTRPSRARHEIVDFAVEKRLGRMATLTYDGAAHDLTVPGCQREFARYVRKLRKLYPGLDWVEVLQRGLKAGRLHHHVLLPNDLRADYIRELWTPGQVDLRERHKASTVRRQAVYVTSDFSGEKDRRVTFHRYRRSRSEESVRTEEFVGTRAELESAVRQMSGSDQEITFIESTHEYCEGILQWNPY